MSEQLLNAIVGTVAGLVGAALGVATTLWSERRRSRHDRARLLTDVMALQELQKARIAAYRDLWRSLDGISTRHPDRIVANLPAVQAKLQDWYYNQGGGLLLEGAADRSASTKAAFFAARDSSSQNLREIWILFHNLREGLRRDLGIFPDDASEKLALVAAHKKLSMFES